MNSRDKALLSAKLTEEQVIEIHNSNRSLRALAQKYGVHHATIHNIKSEASWKYLWLEVN